MKNSEIENILDEMVLLICNNVPNVKIFIVGKKIKKQATRIELRCELLKNVWSNNQLMVLFVIIIW